jgi:tetratricopeptide (TPR) repeat protein
LAKARQCLQAGRFELAADLYREAVKRQPYNWVLLGEVAMFLLYSLRDVKAGLDMAKLALRVNPACSSDLWATLGDGLYEHGRTREALEAYRRALELQAVLPHQQKDLDGASACLERILRARPPEHFTCVDARLYGNRSRSFLAEICRDQGRHLEAETHWRRVVEDCPEFAPTWLDLARLYAQQGRWDEVLDALAHLGSDAQTAPEALVLRGRAHLAREEFTARGARAARLAPGGGGVPGGGPFLPAPAPGDQRSYGVGTCGWLAVAAPLRDPAELCARV